MTVTGDPRLDGYAVPSEWPDPDPPLIWHERYQQLVRVEGFDGTDTNLQWWSRAPGEPWPPDEIRAMFLQHLQLTRLPDTDGVDR